jgi:hypothetical protein
MTFHDSRERKQGVCHIVALPFTIKSILRAKKKKKRKKNYENSKYFTIQKYNLQKKNPLKETNILQDIIITI